VSKQFQPQFGRVFVLVRGLVRRDVRKDAH
jgi:hypothetical protein